MHTNATPHAIRPLKELGFTLKEIALLLDERDHTGLDAARMHAPAQAQRAPIDDRLARLAMVRGHGAAVAEGDDAPIDADGECRRRVDFQATARDPAAPRRARPAGEAASW